MVKTLNISKTVSTDGEISRSVLATEPWQGAWSDHRTLIACYLEQRGLEVPEQVFANIDEDCFVTIYDLNHHLLFASGNFLDIISFPIEEVFRRPWFELYGNVDPRIHQIAHDVVAGKHDDFVDLSDIPVHVPQEIGSKLQVKAHYAPSSLSPMKNEAGKLVGYISTGYLTPEL